jgi:hypothetical protein
MKRMKLLQLIAACMLVMSFGCTNSNTSTDSAAKDTSSVTTDTTSNKDSISSNPDALSDPH